MTEYDAVVYDLDGTLVRLGVDWAALERDLQTLLDEAGVDHADRTAWDLLDAAEAGGVGDRADALIAEREREGARASVRLPLADELCDATTPVGVCSLNAEAACRIALDRHGLAEHVDAVVGRDTVPTRKPDPGPLLAVLDELDVSPERAVFVGDSESDGVTARAAGTAFRYVSGEDDERQGR